MNSFTSLEVIPALLKLIFLQAGLRLGDAQVIVLTSAPVVQSAMLKLSIGQLESDVVKPALDIKISGREA